jgi:hypothetical protein
MLHKRLIHGVLTSLLLFNSYAALAAQCTAKSGANTVPLLELYTSEGCSSCPPADKWLSNLTTDYSKFTPLAFHVDYWDYIGWKDEFSKAAYSDRQRKIAAFSGAGFVYTPQFVMNGRDFRRSDRSRFEQYVDLHQKTQAKAHLSLDATINDNGEMTLKAHANADKTIDYKNTDVFVALYQNQLVTKVKAGENVGRELKHDYVVREFFGAYQFNNQSEFAKSFKLNKVWNERDAGAVIFVQDASNGKIIQSLALPFCSS